MSLKLNFHKFISIILIFTILFYVLVQNLFSFVEYYSLKFRSLESFVNQKKSCKVFSYHKNEIESFKSKITFKEKKEFWFEGSLYDILKTETKNDTIYLICYKDVEETFALSKIKTFVEFYLFGFANSASDKIFSLKKQNIIQFVENIFQLKEKLDKSFSLVMSYTLPKLSPIISIPDPPPKTFFIFF